MKSYELPIDLEALKTNARPLPDRHATQLVRGARTDARLRPVSRSAG
jgi:hypothetical protein